MSYPNIRTYQKLISPNLNIRNSQKTNLWDYFNPKKLDEEVFVDIPDDELLLGVRYDDPDEAFTIPWPKNKRQTFLVQGDNGSGKTNFCQSIAYGQYHDRRGTPILDAGAKLDCHKLLHKNTNPKFVNIIERWGGKAKAYDYAYFITPQFLNILGTIGKKFKLSVEEINELIKISMFSGVDILYSIFACDKYPSSKLPLQTFFTSQDEAPPKNTEELGTRIKHYKERDNSRILDLPLRYNFLVNSGILGDEYINYAKLLKENGILCAEFDSSGKEENEIQSIFIDSILQQSLQDRTLSISSNNTRGYLDIPPLYYIDECHNFAAKGMLPAKTIMKILVTYREIAPAKASEGIDTVGAHLLLSTQHTSVLEKIIVAEVDNFITSKINHKPDIDMLSARGLDSYDIYEIQNLEYPKNLPTFWHIPRENPKNKTAFHPIPAPCFLKS